jgi:hypothetical protein
MPSQKEALKTKLLAHAEQAIEALLNNPKVTEQMSLSEMEQVVGDFEKRLLPEVMQELVSESRQEAELVCPKCGGGSLHNKGKRAKQVITVRGEIEVQRPYYRCIECGHGFFPPG